MLVLSGVPPFFLQEDVRGGLGKALAITAASLSTRTQASALPPGYSVRQKDYIHCVFSVLNK